MTLQIPWTYEKETRENYPCQAFRWVLQMYFWGFGLVHQHHIEGKWHESHTARHEIYFNPNWKFGMEHLYYDGPHCFLRLGLVTVQWYNPNCKKCQ